MAETARGYDISFVEGHKHEKFLREMVENTLKKDPFKAIDKIPLYEQPLKVMLDSGEISEADYKKMSGNLNSYKSKINILNEHNTMTFNSGKDMGVAYEPKYKIKLDDNGNFIHHETGERLTEGQVGRKHLNYLPTKANPDVNFTLADEPTAIKPEVGKITIEDSTKAYDEASKSHISKTPYGPTPWNPNEPSNLNYKTNVVSTKKVSNFLKNNQGRIALGALGVGIAKSFIDGEDDDILSSAGKGIKTAVIGSGISYAAQHLLKKETVQDLVKGEISDTAKNVAKKVDSERRILSKGGKIGTAFKIGLAAAGAATVVDIGQRVNERMEAHDIKAQQEYNLKKKEKRKKEKGKEKSYGHINDGEILFDLFDARSGHYKMGNAKFE